MNQPIQGRMYDESDNGCNWLIFLPIFALVLFVAFIMAIILNIALAFGFYIMLFAPLIAMIPVLFLLFWMNHTGQCRNKIAGGIAGFIAALVLYLGYYWIGMVLTTEPEEPIGLDRLPAYIYHRIHTDKTEDVGHSYRNKGKAADVFENYFFFGSEFLIVTLSLTAVGFVSAGMAWCPHCRKWKKQTVLRLAPGSGPAVIEALQRGKFGEALVSRSMFDRRMPHTALAIDYCQHGEHGWPPCPFLLSIKELKANRSGPGRTQQFDAALGKTLLSRIQMSHDEVVAAATRFAGLEFLPKPTSFTAPPAEASPSGSASPSSNATITSVLAPGAKPVICMKNKIISNALCLVPIALMFAGMAVMLFGVTLLEEASKAGYPQLKTYAGGVLAACGVIGLIYFAYKGLRNSSLYGNKYLKSQCVRRIEQRMDALVQPSDPDATFVEIVPPENIGKPMLETATDIGFLKIDSARNELLFEGNVERWRVPGAAVVSSELGVYRQNAGYVTCAYYFLALQIRRDGAMWQTTLTPREGSGAIGKKKREAQVAEINEQIQRIMAASKKPGPELAEFKF